MATIKKNWVLYQNSVRPYLRMHHIHVMRKCGSKTITYLEYLTSSCLFTIQLMGLRWWLRVVYMWYLPLCGFRLKNCKSKIGQNMAVFGGEGDLNFIFWFYDPKMAHSSMELHLLTYFASKSLVASWLFVIGRTKRSSRVNLGCGKSRMHRNETPKPIWIKFCRMTDICDIITYTTFGDDRFGGLEAAWDQILPFPIDFDRRPYNTRATVRVCDIMLSYQLEWCKVRNCWIVHLFILPLYYSYRHKLSAEHVVLS